MRNLAVFLLAGAMTFASNAEPASGISIDETGTLLRDGKPFRAVGVNYFSAFSRRIADPEDTSYREGLRVLGESGIPFARFMACGFWPIDWKLYQDDPETYFAFLDDVVRAAEDAGVGLVPSLFWWNGAVPDVVGEPRNQWGSAESKTIAFMRKYTREVVSRYVDSPAIWAWEFGNEYNLAIDLPNAADHRPWVVPRNGTPAERSEADDFTHEMLNVALREFGKTVREFDPNRPITSGNSLPRPSAWHQREELSWTRDSREQFAQSLLAQHPDPLDLLSIHVYPHIHGERFEQEYTSYDEILGLGMAAAREAKKPLFVGEFGAPDDAEHGGPDTARREFLQQIADLELNDVPLAALWVYDFPRHEDSTNVTAENSRKHLLRELELANHRIRTYETEGHKVDVASGAWRGRLLDAIANRRRSGNGFNPLRHASYPDQNLFRDDATGLYFEHIFNGTAADHDIAMFTPNADPHIVVANGPASATIRYPAEGNTWGMASEMRFTLNGDTVDMEFRATPTEDRFPLGFAAFMWASYMNHTRERRFYFYGMDGDREGWLSFGEDTEDGFETGTIAYHGVPPLPYEEGAQTLNLIEHPAKTFLLPFYYGLVDGDGNPETHDDTMAYVMMFDRKEPMRLALWNFIKNAAGKFDPHSPAWDWQFVIRDPVPGQTYGYRARVLYVPFTSAEDIRGAYEEWIASLPEWAP
ncbi:MAG: cellulase family glycosylhydrolase [Candidatus Hydrogenedentes bacterium]|nr:cellulase family glycosylhydrolase [Candidatus Hydrogenedentota bacterium]